ncbi:hypothetical protein KJ632_02165 [Patescibacteria group bacterium]|nr:hypothetical protein [Patescibacteria group bacterium]
MAQKAQKSYVEKGFGMDPLGFDVIKMAVRGLVYTLVLNPIQERSPERIQPCINCLINKTLREGDIPNIILAKETMILEGERAKKYQGSEEPLTVMEKGKIALADVGMFNFKTGLKRHITQLWLKPLFYLSWGTIMELLERYKPKIVEREECPFKEGQYLPLTRASIKAVKATDSFLRDLSKNPTETIKDRIRNIDLVKIAKSLNPLPLLKKIAKIGIESIKAPQRIPEKLWKQICIENEKLWRKIGLVVLEINLPAFKEYNRRHPKKIEDDKCA